MSAAAYGNESVLEVLLESKEIDVNKIGDYDVSCTGISSTFLLAVVRPGCRSPRKELVSTTLLFTAISNVFACCWPTHGPTALTD